MFPLKGSTNHSSRSIQCTKFLSIYRFIIENIMSWVPTPSGIMMASMVSFFSPSFQSFLWL
jgi:hypothetical protein